MDNELEVLNEMYFGKIPQLLMIEELFDKFKTKYKKYDAMKDRRAYREMIKDSILTKIGKAISDAFGYKEVALTIARDDTANAYTISFLADSKGNSYDENEKAFTPEQVKQSVIVTNRGFKFNKDKFAINLLICLNLGILFTPVFTTQELMAILMHEIGHSYSKVVIPAKQVSGRVDEKFADQFVAMYGYGNDFITAFTKMDYSYGPIEDKLKNVPIINILVGLNKIYDRYLVRSIGLDEHPAVKSRMMSQITQLEGELKNQDMSPEMRKDIQKQIDMCKKSIDTYYNTYDTTTDKMLKKYGYEYEPEIGTEKELEIGANRKTAPDVLNKTINDMYHKKGFFKVW